MKEKTPHVHHIVPNGNFSNRNPKVYEEVKEMHSILKKAKINVRFSPENLMVVSSSYHAALHTDAYIHHIYSYLKPAEGNSDAVHLALFMLRIEIASEDSGAWGF